MAVGRRLSATAFGRRLSAVCCRQSAAAFSMQLLQRAEYVTDSASDSESDSDSDSESESVSDSANFQHCIYDPLSLRSLCETLRLKKSYNACGSLEGNGASKKENPALGCRQPALRNGYLLHSLCLLEMRSSGGIPTRTRILNLTMNPSRPRSPFGPSHSNSPLRSPTSLSLVRQLVQPLTD